MNTWKPINYRGTIYYDPREELRARARHGAQDNATYVLVPMQLALACAELHECDATTIATHDEDGPLPEPLRIFCRLPRDHHLTGQIKHYNGYTHWEG